jgi:hypothetical protein
LKLGDTSVDVADADGPQTISFPGDMRPLYCCCNQALLPFGGVSTDPRDAGEQDSNLHRNPNRKHSPLRLFARRMFCVLQRVSNPRRYQRRSHLKSERGTFRLNPRVPPRSTPKGNAGARLIARSLFET